MSLIRKMVGEELAEIVRNAKNGGPRARIGLMASGSELGREELQRGAEEAARLYPDVQVVMIGPGPESSSPFEWVSTGPEERNMADGMDRALKEGKIDGAVALHYPFPLGVTTVGRVVTPSRGKPMLMASTTGASATFRTEAMTLNALYGIAVARAIGIDKPSVGILNVEGAQLVYRNLEKLKENGYEVNFGQSVRKDGGAVLRGNDILAGAVDVCVTDTLTGNVLMKLFSAYTSGGNYESSGWGYGPSVGKNWKQVVSIISRASGAPVISNAIRFTADAVFGNLVQKTSEEMGKAGRAGLEAVLADSTVGKGVVKEEVSAPPQEPTDEELNGVDVLSVEDAVLELWKKGIYAESAMGCTGPVVKVASPKVAEAMEILKKGNYL